MKKWIIIDDCTGSKSAQFEEIIDARDINEAEQIARRQWDSLTAYDQQKRDAYYVGRAEIDEEGTVDFDSMRDIVTIK